MTEQTKEQSGEDTPPAPDEQAYKNLTEQQIRDEQRRKEADAAPEGSSQNSQPGAGSSS
jgi:hypothetical protein